MYNVHLDGLFFIVRISLYFPTSNSLYIKSYFVCLYSLIRKIMLLFILYLLKRKWHSKPVWIKCSLKFVNLHFCSNYDVMCKINHIRPNLIRPVFGKTVAQLGRYIEDALYSLIWDTPCLSGWFTDDRVVEFCKSSHVLRNRKTWFAALVFFNVYKNYTTLIQLSKSNWLLFLVWYELKLYHNKHI